MDDTKKATFTESFAFALRAELKRLGLKQIGMCSLLYDIPMRTFQSWLRGGKEPPVYVQKLILERLARQNPKTIKAVKKGKNRK